MSAAAKQRWSSPETMLGTYAYLFKTADTRLRAQMSPALWRLVYDFVPLRNRAMSWADPMAQTSYTRIHALERDLETEAAFRKRLADLQRNAEGLSLEALQPMIERQQRALDELTASIANRRTSHFAPPRRNIDYRTNLSFEVQADPYYCSVHAFNNLARAVVLSPPDILAAIECTRTLDVRQAAPEDVMLAALREGVLLLQLKLTDVDDLLPLDNRKLPETNHFASLLNDVGGMLVYQPGALSGTGHYVTLLRAPNNGGWLIYSTDSVVARGATAADALHSYIAQSSDISVDEYTDAYEARTYAAAGAGASLAERPVAPHAFVGLMPLSVHHLWATPEGGETGTTILVRTLVRKTLSEWRMRPATDRSMLCDVFLPEPLSPCAIEEIGWFIGYSNTPTVRCRATGFEATNAASFVGNRHWVYRELNMHAEEMTRALLDEQFAEFWQVLVHTRSHLRTLATIGTLFMGNDHLRQETLPGIEVMTTFSDILMSNRRWFRLVVLELVSSALAQQMEANGKVLDDDAFPVAILFCLLCYHNLAGYGVCAPANIEASYVQLATLAMRRDCFPCDSVPDVLRELVDDEYSELRWINRFPNYDMTFWLLRAAQKLHSFALSPKLVQAFALPASSCSDDNQSDTDREAVLVSALRRTLFRLPLADEDFARVQTVLREQWCFETPVLAEHNLQSVAMLQEIVKREPQLALDEQDVLHLVDVLAFDVRYIEQARQRQQQPQQQLKDGSHEGKPRFLERAALGFAHIHVRTFSALSFVFDKRPPATRNIDRVAMPLNSNEWPTAYVRVEEAQRRAVVPLARLQRYVAAVLEAVATESFNVSSSDPASRTEWHLVQSKRRRTANAAPRPST